VSSSTFRVVAAAVAFAVVAIGGIVALDFGESQAITSWAYVTLAALAVGFVVYAAVEYWQTRRFNSITRQFDTRTLVLMPIAIALNIILGQAVGSALKIPIYLDSIGTILVGALAGPIPGALTGLLANLLWTAVVPPPFHSDIAAAFAVVAAVIGLLAGAFSRFGWLRPRPTRDTTRLAFGALAAAAVVLILGWLAFLGFQSILGDISFIPTPESDPVLYVLAILALIVVVGTIIGLLAMLFVRRDLTAAYVVIAGVVTGIIAAVISAPISANLFSGVTGAGTDFLVAAFRQGGAEIGAATLGQGLISDPIDKVITFAVVYVILGAMATRTKARFPQGERLINVEESA
jgi:hypothetical protein